MAWNTYHLLPPCWSYFISSIWEQADYRQWKTRDQLAKSKTPCALFKRSLMEGTIPYLHTIITELLSIGTRWWSIFKINYGSKSQAYGLFSQGVIHIWFQSILSCWAEMKQRENVQWPMVSSGIRKAYPGKSKVSTWFCPIKFYYHRNDFDRSGLGADSVMLYWHYVLLYLSELIIDIQF